VSATDLSERACRIKQRGDHQYFGFGPFLILHDGFLQAFFLQAFERPIWPRASPEPTE
jgi:hypothetical protein